MQSLAEKDFADSLYGAKIAWQSEHADTFMKSGLQLNNSIIITSGNLMKIAEDIRTAAKRIYEAELWSLRIAQVRCY